MDLETDLSGNCPALSVVIPFFNEEENVEEVAREVIAVLRSSFNEAWELVLVDDGSRDKTGEILDRLAAGESGVVAVHLRPNSGQSAALEAGFRASRGVVIGTLDGDGQNDPADLPKLYAEMKSRGVAMMCGIRARRQDSLLRKVSSRIANRVRGSVLGDRITDVGCSLRVFRRDAALRINFFRNAHRFLPALFQMRGFSVAEAPVNHRVRAHGVSKYGRGVASRLWVGITDLTGVFWLKRRALRYEVTCSRDDGNSAPDGK